MTDNQSQNLPFCSLSAILGRACVSSFLGLRISPVIPRISATQSYGGRDTPQNPRWRKPCERPTPATDNVYGITTAMLELLYICSAAINLSVRCNPPALACQLRAPTIRFPVAVFSHTCAHECARRPARSGRRRSACLVKVGAALRAARAALCARSPRSRE